MNQKDNPELGEQLFVTFYKRFVYFSLDVYDTT